MMTLSTLQVRALSQLAWTLSDHVVSLSLLQIPAVGIDAHFVRDSTVKNNKIDFNEHL